MPVQVTYPGVYVEEIPSGVRTITGVATAIAAFVGWIPKGSVEKPELILSWSDFERKCGGLHPNSLLSYAVYHFFANGGQRAYVVRLVTTGSGTAADNAAAASVSLDGKLKVATRNPGSWGSQYAIVTRKQNTDPKRFQLKVMYVQDGKKAKKADKKGIAVEVFENLSMAADDPRHVVNVLGEESAVAVAEVIAGATDPPEDTKIPPAGDPAAGEIPDVAFLDGGQEGKLLDPIADAAGFVAAGQLAAPSGSTGVFLLDRIDLFNILCVPGLADVTALSSLEKFCRDRRAFLIVDCASGATLDSLQDGPDTTLTGDNAINAAFYFPWVSAPDPLQEYRPKDFPPCGFVAGLYARTDASRGVWKAPAGTEASITGALGVKNVLTNDENGVLNPKAVNCIRNLAPYGTLLWGARTLQGNDERGSEWKYVPVRRTALFLEESLFRALKWVVFEPNDEPLWAQIRLNVGAFLHDLFRQGAFQGKTPQEAYFVKCDKETTTQNDINRGVVNIVVGFAPLKPAEFVIIRIQQIAGQIQT
jgi:Bacteriophage tail sheath protein